MSVIAISVVQLILLTLTGHYGANMTHGPTFLVEKAPQIIRTMAGLSPAVPPRPKPASLDVAVVFPDIIQPIFDRRCVGCHNDQKTKGELKLNSHAAILTGGKTGAAVIANSLAGSELYKRITLFEGDENFMPAEGKTPLSENQVSLIKWWIETGASENAHIKDIDVPSEIQAVIATELGFVSVEMKNVAAEVDEAIIAKLENAGFKIRRIIQNEPYVDVIYSTPRVPLSDDVLNLLIGIKDQLTNLKLSRSSLSDAQLTLVGQLTELNSLNISGTNVTNAGINQLQNLSKLQTLNVFSTDVNDTVTETLKNLPELSYIYQGE